MGSFQQFNYLKLAGIRSDRYHQYKYWFQIVYEWEDEFAKTLKLPVKSNRHIFYDNKYVLKVLGKCGIYKFFQMVDKLKRSSSKDVYFDMGPRFTYNHDTSVNVIPIIIDFWKYININRFNLMYATTPLVCISSLEAYVHLKSNGCSVNLAFLPLSLPDKYQIDEKKPYEKKYDFIVAGRTNPVLEQYLLTFSNEYPSIEYITTINEGKSMYYHSNKTGIVGPANNREEYLEMIKKAKISFYATPGIDGGEERTGGFNPVTPRFFELLYAGCYIIGRYPKTIETDYFELDKICPAVNNYQDFKRIANYYLSLKFQPLIQNKEYLKKHYTSQRANQLQELVNNL